MVYSFDEIMKPIWDGDVAYYESILPLSDKSGNDIVIPMLYRADEIISVYNYEMTEQFDKGTVYDLLDGNISILQSDKFEPMTTSFYNPETPPASDLIFPSKDGGYMYFTEGVQILEKQLLVSYRHSDKWEGYRPFADSRKLVRSKNLIHSGKNITIGFYGDSITVGCNASKMMGISPYMPVWPELVCKYLEKNYNCTVNYINHARGGTTSGWGAQNVREQFRNDRPDLVIIAFGKNDGIDVVKDEYEANIEKIADTILEINPDCEFIFVTSTLPNPMVMGHDNHFEREPLICELESKYNGKADTAKMTSIHGYILTKKQYKDMAANNVNHPNDYIIRLYAQTIAELLR